MRKDSKGDFLSSTNSYSRVRFKEAKRDASAEVRLAVTLRCVSVCSDASNVWLIPALRTQAQGHGRILMRF